MAEVQPLRALRYEPEVVGPLDSVVAPPYDVIDPEQRARLAARSPNNVVHVDVPRDGADPYARAGETLARWRDEGAVVREAGAGVAAGAPVSAFAGGATYTLDFGARG